jgi:hypothetical protein
MQFRFCYFLQRAVAAMPVEEAAKHIKRCEESGLWVPGG